MKKLTANQRKTKNKKAAVALMKDQRRHGWYYERLFKKFLEREGINHIHQKPFYSSEWHYCVDFYIPGLKMVIEIDGKTHKKKKDKIRSRNLMTTVFVEEIIRVKNVDLRNNPSRVYHNVVLEIKNRLC